MHIDDFVDGCMRMRGQAKAIDLHTILLETRARYNSLAEFMALTQQKLEEIGNVVVSHSVPPLGYQLRPSM